jgi:hypothetical protein
MEGSVKVEVKDDIIIAHYYGAMTEAIVKEGQTLIEKHLYETNSKLILYNILEMELPATRLAFDMQEFDKLVRERVNKSATVVSGAESAFKAELSFVLSKNHQIFYNDLQKAMEWLKS